MLEGKLVGLKPLEQADAWLMHKWFNDQRVLEDLGGDTYFAVSLEEENAFVQHMVNDDKAVWFIVTELKQKEQIGVIGLAAMDERSSSAELRIVIGEPKFWDKGYGSDAIGLVLREAFVARHLHRVWLRVVTYNERAISCYRKCGFTLEGTARHDHFHKGHWSDAHHMSILAGEYRGRKHARR
ncbi:MAG TPA: GNAT family protein [Methanomassiliicoccales archaeon]|nr:GNAT family protein [Methanomassiliicoccales archaeon]